MKYLESSELRSLDWWDLWATSFGARAKNLYLKNKYLGLLFVGPLLAMDIIYPKMRKWFASERTFPICHAHMGLGYLNLYSITNEDKFFDKAERLVQPLLEMASPRANGLGWGMKHEWITTEGLIPADTPCNTQTAYCYEFFEKLYLIQNNTIYLKKMEAILRHVISDFPEWRDGDTLSCSYSMSDKRRVINANSYRMFMLLSGSNYFSDPIYREKGLATLRYVLGMQKQDGSWPYSEKESFVDTYHTCFVLKNLIKSLPYTKDLKNVVEQAIENGFQYYYTFLFDDDGHPRPFSVKPRIVLHKYDSYDLAECIGLLADLNLESKRLEKLLYFAKSKFHTDAGWFIFRLYPLLKLKGIPYIRYANSAMFLNLTKVLLTSDVKK